MAVRAYSIRLYFAAIGRRAYSIEHHHFQFIYFWLSYSGFRVSLVQMTRYGTRLVIH
jgi:hypothetical protein